MFVESRDQAREFFVRVWQRMEAGLALEPLESLVAEVIRAHPEYHASLDGGGDVLGVEFDSEHAGANPFLHMGLHIALVEQLQTDRPPGVREVYRDVLARFEGHPHEAEHHMMELLGRELWRAGQAGRVPDPLAYLDAVRQSIA